MPLGDSISMGSNYPGAYRIELERLFRENSIDPIFVGSQSNGPSELQSKNHEGHSGWTISQITAITEDRLRMYRPDVVLLMIGTNDMANASLSTPPDVTAALERLEDLVEIIFHSQAGVRLILSTIPPTTQFWNEFVVEYNKGIRDIYIDQLNSGHNIRFSDSYSALTVADLDLNDGVGGAHPLQVGYGKIAGAWFQAFQ